MTLERSWSQAIEAGLHIFDAAGDGHDGVLVGHDEAILAEGAVAAIGVVPAAPELETVALIPIALRVAAVGGLFGGGHRDPFRGEQLLAIPAAVLQIKLAELGDVLGADAQTV